MQTPEVKSSERIAANYRSQFVSFYVFLLTLDTVVDYITATRTVYLLIEPLGGSKDEEETVRSSCFTVLLYSFCCEF